MVNELGISDPDSDNVPPQLECSTSTYLHVSIILETIVNKHHS